MTERTPTRREQQYLDRLLQQRGTARTRAIRLLPQIRAARNEGLSLARIHRHYQRTLRMSYGRFKALMRELEAEPPSFLNLDQFPELPPGVRACWFDIVLLLRGGMTRSRVYALLGERMGIGRMQFYNVMRRPMQGLEQIDRLGRTASPARGATTGRGAGSATRPVAYYPGAVHGRLHELYGKRDDEPRFVGELAELISARAAEIAASGVLDRYRPGAGTGQDLFDYLDYGAANTSPYPHLDIFRSNLCTLQRQATAEAWYGRPVTRGEEKNDRSDAARIYREFLGARCARESLQRGRSEPLAPQAERDDKAAWDRIAAKYR